MEDQRQFFDELITVDWDSYASPFWDKTRAFEVRSLLSRVSPKRVLDVGCGVGYHDLLFAQDAGVQEVHGIDYSSKSIEAAEQTYPHPLVRRSVADIYKLGIGSHDLVFSFQVVEHLTDPVGFFRACRRQVSNGGWVAVGTPNRKRLINRVLRLIGRPEQLQDPHHFREYTPSELAAVAEEVGLQHVDTFTYGMSFVVPKLGWEVVPRPLYLPLGRMFPSIANLFCSIFYAPPLEPSLEQPGKPPAVN